MSAKQNYPFVHPPKSIFRPLKVQSWHQLVSWLLLSLLVVLTVHYGIQHFLTTADGPVNLVVYAFSTQEEVCTQALFPAFEAAWEQENGRELTIEAVFGASGTLANQIVLGAPADVALFSNAQHVTWLKVARLVPAGSEPVLFGYTPMIIVTRPGNPASLMEFADLAQPGLTLLHAEPRDSGAGDWAVLAEYGSAWIETGNDTAATAQLTAIWDNVQLLAPSARAAMTTFELGAGDALVTYEQDALLAQERGVPLEIIIPLRTILAQYVAVTVNDNLVGDERSVASAFLDFLMCADGQMIRVVITCVQQSLAPKSCRHSVKPSP
jgi:sulfate transport system substrate-binding protein